MEKSFSRFFSGSFLTWVIWGSVGLVDTWVSQSMSEWVSETFKVSLCVCVRVSVFVGQRLPQKFRNEVKLWKKSSDIFSSLCECVCVCIQEHHITEKTPVTEREREQERKNRELIKAEVKFKEYQVMVLNVFCCYKAQT